MCCASLRRRGCTGLQLVRAAWVADKLVPEEVGAANEDDEGDVAEVYRERSGQHLERHQRDLGRVRSWSWGWWLGLGSGLGVGLGLGLGLDSG